ncbi:hypothetical protein AMELA_G00138060 [Ameiurus melas]|uniref:Uncharacterized protein n=1 Tax=Ameiurus melas TaxID=219545 RepID=A0A7J6AP49_AMEME|nr:hypothetical protein AMELA_G00138060 [Ameiurus melas]
MVKSAALFCSQPAQTLVRDESDFLFSAFSAGSTPIRHRDVMACVPSARACVRRKVFISELPSWLVSLHYYFTGETERETEERQTPSSSLSVPT